MPQHTNIACGHNGKILLCDVFALFSTWSAAVFLPGVLEELRAASPVQDMQHVASAMQNIEQAAPAHRRGSPCGHAAAAGEHTVSPQQWRTHWHHHIVLLILCHISRHNSPTRRTPRIAPGGPRPGPGGVRRVQGVGGAGISRPRPVHPRLPRHGPRHQRRPEPGPAGQVVANHPRPRRVQRRHGVKGHGGPDRVRGVHPGHRRVRRPERPAAAAPLGDHHDYNGEERRRRGREAALCAGEGRDRGNEWG